MPNIGTGTNRGTDVHRQLAIKYMWNIPHSQVSNANTITDPALQACQDQYNKAAIQLAFIVACLYTGGCARCFVENVDGRVL